MTAKPHGLAVMLLSAAVLTLPMLMPMPLVPRSPRPRMRPPSVTTMICKRCDSPVKPCRIWQSASH